MSERDGCEQVKNPSYILGGWGPRAVGGAVGLQRLTGSWQPTCFFCRLPPSVLYYVFSLRIYACAIFNMAT